ncbi:peroxisomal multifunctional enzyme type 2 [Aphidius gifuensis]|uniref:peroxisomal multifunctional enzyme type 2 n=1 Tax=Aphidius gifuensis TaxID=684658 RepID=UPI001CDC44B7|nr:peroxisomal multifunctional enzyme type 2 [Aphidius gifuensis]
MSSELRFDGKVVVVTGSGAGLGRAYALAFAARGAKVVINDLGSGRHGDGSSTKVADQVVDEITKNGGIAVANYDSVLDGDKIIKTAIDAFGKIDILINNAGILRDKSFVKMSDNDWNIIQDVHLKGSMKTTHAAWPYFRKQKYGKIIFTSSNAALYGNFGQANYSAAKMGLIGLANTLSIEGQSSNISTNVIVPTAGSRLTEGIVPPDFWKELKPELIAPIVLWLCHDDCQENGSIIESALGWAGKCHIVRSNGVILRKNINDPVTLEAVRDNWSSVTDMSNAQRFETIAEEAADLMGVVDKLSQSSQQTDKTYSVKHTYNFKDAILYALSIGASIKDPREFRYLYESNDNFSVFPTYYVVYGPLAAFETTLIHDSLQRDDINLAGAVHGEQYLKVLKTIPVEANVETRVYFQDILDKGRHAFVLIKHETYEVDSGDKISEGQIVAIFQGAGGFGGKKKSIHEIPSYEMPKRKADFTVIQKTSVEQAAFYRLTSGDTNPLHIDPDVAKMVGFKQPIQHGLCSLGFSVRHVLNTFASGDSKLFDCLRARFSKPVIPGQTLKTDMWREGNRIHFQTTTVETNTPVITFAHVDLKDIKISEFASKL